MFILHHLKKNIYFLYNFILLLFTADLENLTTVERIQFLQEKLQEVRKHYLSLKSEVASIDRRRRHSKKEREGMFVLRIL